MNTSDCISKNVYSLYAGLFVLLASPAINAEVPERAWLCLNCIDMQSAEQQARRYAPELRCQYNTPSGQPELGGELKCEGDQLDVVLVNPDTGDLFAFRVGHEDQSPWLLRSETIGLPPARLEAYRRSIQFINKWREFRTQPIIVPPGASVSMDGGGACPVDTALDWAIMPGGREKAKRFIREAVAEAVGNDIDNLWRNVFMVNEFFGATHHNETVSIRIPASADSSGAWDDVGELFLRFSESEDPNTPGDFLVFEAEYQGTYPNSSNPMLDLEFLPEKSFVAGSEFEDLAGGQVAIDNECILAKLAELDASGPGEFTGSGGSSLGGGTLPWSPGASPGGEDCWQVVEFWQGGRKLYEWVVPCGEG